MSLKIMATADVHLGMKFAAYGELQGRLAEARFASLSAVVSAANQNGCNLLIVAGDLFHRVGVAAATVERAAAILGGFEGEAVAVLPGNHDFKSSDADRLWSAFVEASGDRTLLLASPEPYDLGPLDLDLVLLAAPCDAVHGAEPRVGWMRGYEAQASGPALVGVAHGSIDGLTLDSEGRYFPMSTSLLSGLPPHLWVVGHTHRQHHLAQARLLVPGTPEPDGFDFTGPGRAALVTAADDLRDGFTVTPVETGQLTFAEVSVHLDPEQEIASQLAAAVPDERSLVKLSVHGTLRSEDLPRLRAELDALASRALLLRIDESGLRTMVTRREVDRWFATGSFAHRLLSDLLDAGEDAAASAALELIGDAGGEVAP